MTTTLRASLLILASGALATAQAPQLERLEPRGVRLGQRATIRLEGERLDKVTDALFYREGMRLVEFKAIDDEEAEATIVVGPDCPQGEHPFWLVGPTGVSQMRTLHVGRLRLVDEQEPNDAPADANAAEIDESLGVTLVGGLTEADTDCFRFSLQRGERLSAEVNAMRLGGEFLDAHVDILGPDGEVLGACDDTALARQDPLASIVAPTGGDYIVRVREAAFGGDYDSRYHLHVGRFPRPTVAYPAGGSPGAELETQLLGDASGPRSTKIRLPGWVDAETFAWRPSEEGAGVAPTPIRFRVIGLENVLEAEPNEDAATATPGGRGPVALNGVLSEPGDVDSFAFDADEGDTFDVQAYGARIGSPIDSVVEIFSPDGSPLVANDDGAVHDSTLRFRAVTSGRHVVRVSDHLSRGGPTYVYRVEFTPIEPGIDLAIPIADARRPQREQAITVPQGGRFAMLVAARRRGFDGTVTVDVGPLPGGVELVSAPIPAGEHLALLLLEADADAAPGASLVEVTAMADTPSGTVEGRMRNQIGLVFGEPRRTAYHTVETTKTPLVVTQPAPFDLWVEPPLAPLASDGLMELRVQVTRRDGFDGEIELTAPLMPEWVERSEDPVLLGRREETALFPLISGDRATAGTHAMLLVGAADIDGTRVSVASQPFEVRIAPPHAQIVIERVATEQGRDATLSCRIDWLRQPEGGATATLRGLPKYAEAPTVPVDAETQRFQFPISVGAETPASIHNTLFVELAVPESGEPVRQYLGRGGTLEVFPQGGSARETLSRLEVLRRQAKAALRAVPAGVTD